MRHFYKAHGRHCYLRSFQTKCPKCGVDVLYWECTHGSPIVVKIPKGLLENGSPSCPVCGKLFKNDKDLNNHLETLRKDDKPHKTFFKNKFIFQNDSWNSNQKNIDQIKLYDKPKFGRINIKKKN